MISVAYRSKAKIFIVLIAILIAIIWYGLNFIRTGHFWAFIVTPTFFEIPQNRVKFVGDFHSYTSKKELLTQLSSKKRQLKLIWTRESIALRRRPPFIVERYSVDDFGDSEKALPNEFVFYNSRLGSVSVCKKGDIIQIQNLGEKLLGQKIDQYSKVEKGFLVIEIKLRDDHNCIEWSDRRFLEEEELWTDLFS